MEQSRWHGDELLTLTITDLEQMKAMENFKLRLERCEGVLLNFGNHPFITMDGGRIQRNILAFSAVYRKGNTTRYSVFKYDRSITSLSDSWKILMLTETQVPKLYLLHDDRLIFFPEERNPLSNADFLEIHYQTESYHGIIRLNCLTGVHSVFSEVMVNHYGVIYSQVVNEMASLVVDICAYEEIRNIENRRILKRGAGY
ncbi:MAG: hypothetical protein FWB87_04225 [Defluviitaleaceae bacterium]|nr:hypothetical protein [Defluviitaleaceae bacterium]